MTLLIGSATATIGGLFCFIYKAVDQICNDYEETPDYHRDVPMR